MLLSYTMMLRLHYQLDWTRGESGSVGGVKRCLDVMLVGLVALLASCVSQAGAAPLKVAATIFPLYDMVRQVAGGEVEVTLLVAPGASPHTAAFKPSMMRQLAGSAALFTIGYGLDDWASRLAADAGVKRVVRSHGDQPLPTEVHTAHRHADAAPHDTGADPHYWLSIPNAIHMVHVIAKALTELDPDGASGYAQRAAQAAQTMRGGGPRHPSATGRCAAARHRVVPRRLCLFCRRL